MKKFNNLKAYKFEKKKRKCHERRDMSDSNCYKINGNGAGFDTRWREIERQPQRSTIYLSLFVERFDSILSLAFLNMVSVELFLVLILRALPRANACICCILQNVGLLPKHSNFFFVA